MEYFNQWHCRICAAATYDSADNLKLTAVNKVGLDKCKLHAKYLYTGVCWCIYWFIDWCLRRHRHVLHNSNKASLFKLKGKLNRVIRAIQMLLCYNNYCIIFFSNNILRCISRIEIAKANYHTLGQYYVYVFSTQNQGCSTIGIKRRLLVVLTYRGIGCLVWVYALRPLMDDPLIQATYTQKSFVWNLRQIVSKTLVECLFALHIRNSYCNGKVTTFYLIWT